MVCFHNIVDVFWGTFWRSFREKSTFSKKSSEIQKNLFQNLQQNGDLEAIEKKLVKMPPKMPIQHLYSKFCEGTYATFCPFYGEKCPLHKIFEVPEENLLKNPNFLILKNFSWNPILKWLLTLPSTMLSEDVDP